jgi:hypothetical protein
LHLEPGRGVAFLHCKTEDALTGRGRARDPREPRGVVRHAGEREQLFRRALDEKHRLSVGTAVQARHEPVCCVEGHFIEARPLGTHVLGVEARLHRERDQRPLHRVAFDCPGRIAQAQLGVVAQQPAAHEGHRRGDARRVVVVPDGLDVALGRIAGARHGALVLGGDHAPRCHFVARERAGLVGADHRSRAERLDRGQAADDRVARRHAAHPERERNRDHRGQALRHHADRKRYHPEQRLHPGEVAHQHGEGKKRGRASDREPGEPPREAVHLAYERRGQRLDRLEQRADASDLGGWASRHYHPAPLAGRHQRARVGHAVARAKVGIGRCRRVVLCRGNRFPGEERFIDKQPSRAQQAQVGRHAVAGFDQHDVARHQARRRHAHAPAVSQHARLRRDHAPHGRERFLGLAFLDESHEGVHQHHSDNRPGVDRVAEDRGAERRGEQEVDQHVVELRGDARERMARLCFRKGVRSVSCEPRRGLAGVQAALGRAQLGEHLRRALAVRSFHPAVKHVAVEHVAIEHVAI